MRSALIFGFLALAACGGHHHGGSPDAALADDATVPSTAGELIDAGEPTDATDADEPTDTADADAQPGDASGPSPLARPFPILGWCAPNSSFTSLARYAEYRGAEFTDTFMPCDYPTDKGQILAILDAAASAGMTVLVRDDTRMPSSISNDPQSTSKLDALIADYASHPGFGGFRVRDEPEVGDLPGYAEVVAYLRAHDPSHLHFINLFGLNHYSDAASYEAYVDTFLRLVHPQVVSFDNYTLETTGDLPGFDPALEIVRRLSLKYGVPFWQIVLDVPHLSYRLPTAAEKRWEAMQTLAYGGAGLAWFIYWERTDQPGANFGTALVDTTGVRTFQYEEVRAINADVKTIAGHLQGAVSEIACTSGTAVAGTTPCPSDAIVRFDTCDLTVGVFRDAATRLVLVANRDHGHACSTHATWAAAAVEELDRASDTWGELDVASDAGAGAPITIPAGDALLFRVAAP
jgi:hypothetical protein